MMNEVLNGIKVIKLYAWETPMMEAIERIRSEELRCIRNAGLINCCVDVFNGACPFLVAVISFATFSMLSSEHILTPQVAFIALTLFNQLRSPMTMLGYLINQTVQAVVSNRRLKDFLVADEIDPHSVERPTDGHCSDVIKIHNANLAWDMPEKGKMANHPPATLQNLSVEIASGSLVAVVGKVGSAKSSLLSALLGEMERLSGQISVRSRCAYVPQVG